MHVNLNVKAGATVEGKKRGRGGGGRAGMGVQRRVFIFFLVVIPVQAGIQSVQGLLGITLMLDCVSGSSLRCMRNDTFY